jgi:carbon-monoxide dehydrogenase medium subunit
VKAAPFEYACPDTIEEAVALMDEHGAEARPLAGGQSLVPLMAFRLARPAVLVDLNRLHDLAGIDSRADDVQVGAMVRELAAERSTTIAERVPLLAAALPFIGHHAIRARGTIGGSCAHSDPAAELPAVAVAMGARFTARSHRRGDRSIAAADFFESHFTTALADDELLIDVTFPVTADRMGVAFHELARRHGDFAVVGVAAMLGLHDGRIRDARVVVTGVAERPFRATAAEATLVDAEPTVAVFTEAGRVARQDLEPPSDLHGSAAYRRHVAGVLIRKALVEAAANCAVSP